MTKQSPTFYIFHGDDLFALEEEVAKMHARMGDPGTAELNTSTFDGKKASVGEVFNAVSALPFLSDKRLVVVSGWLSWLSRSGAGKTGKEQLKQIADQLPDLPDWARLVFVEREPLKENNPVFKLARTDPHGYIKTFRQPKDPGKWIRKRLETYGADIEPAAIPPLLTVLGDNLIALDNELFKLAAYVGGERPISPHDVAALTSYVPEEKIFDMVDALGKRDGKTATRMLQRLLDDADPLSLFAMIVRQFRLLLQVQEFVDNGGGPGTAMAKTIKIHSFVAKKLVEQSHNYNMDDLEYIYRHLLDIDRNIKTGKIDPTLALHMLVTGLSN